MKGIGNQRTGDTERTTGELVANESIDNQRTSDTERTTGELVANESIGNQRTSDTERTTGELPMKGLITRELVIQREQQESCQ